jgi:hypothetical protein
MLLILFLLFYPEADKAVGISDKGELSNVSSNFGLIANLHYFTPAFHWPNAAVFQHQYCPGFGILAARNDTVIESVLNLALPEWAPLEGSYGSLYSGEVTTPDGTPVIATSDNSETWPRDAYGEPFWPGPFRKDTLGQEVVGEFTSDQDLYCVYNDQDVFGIQVDQSVYSYGRIYAQDFIFYDFHLYAPQHAPVDDVYLGFYGNFRVDYDNHDYIGLYRDSMMTFVYYWDADGIPQDPWESVGMIGVAFFNMPVDNFHYFEKEHIEVKDDTILYPIIASIPSDPSIDSSRFFHGDNIYIDDPSQIQILPPESTTVYNYIVSSGPVDIGAYDTLQFSIAVVCGNDSSDLFENLDMALFMAERYFLGSGPPDKPTVTGVAHDRMVTLYWEPEPSESSIDIITGKQDFEGYKIYRSEDLGMTWGDMITNDKGEVVGYVPLAQFDLIDGIEGPDPAFPYQSLGDETGLKHTFVDSTVYNGIEYWYCVAAYDQGNQVPDSLEASYENPRGRPTASNVVSVVPARPPSGYESGYVLDGDTLEPIGGPCEGLALVRIVNPAELQARTYEITFNDTLINDTTFTTFNLFDITTEYAAEPETLLSDHPLSDSSLDNIPVIDGFRLTLFNPGYGVKSMEWTYVQQDTCTFQWWRWIGDYSTMVSEPYLYGTSDFRVIIDHNANSIFHVEDGFGSDSLTIQMPIKVFDITDSQNPVDVSEYCWLLDYSYYDYFSPPIESLYFGPEGWDLIPGGAGYNPAAVGQAIGFFDQIGLWNGDSLTATGVIYFATQNGPDSTTTAPSDGDEFTIRTFKPFGEDISYQFTIVPSSIIADSIDLSKVMVVPNPYILHSKFETTPYDRRLMFTNLPEQCEIDIYNIAGEHINTVHHTNNLGYEYWDLRTKYGLEVAYGLYIFVVHTDNETKAKGKFAIIK